MNGARTHRAWLRRTFVCAALAAVAWSCLALVENRHQAWAQEMQQSPAFYPAAHSVTVDNFFSGLR
ncbi:MAG TPA: hypothetical protein VEN29_04875 [Casimicrobiaceae bacterium]|nr:hypothetical protein [Casimicrobiaceae bacterium]